MATVQLTGDWLQNIGNRRQVVGTITFSASYSTGGESVTPAMVGLGALDSLDFNTGIAGLIFVWDKANNKVKVFYPTGGGTASPAAIGDPRVSSGASSATAVDATQPNITPGRGKEALATTDLSSVVVDFIAVGR